MPMTDQLETARIALGVLLVLSNIAVWLGVYLERDKFSKETQDRGWRILVSALALEAALAVFLLATDTTISLRQRWQIASLERQIGPRFLTADEQHSLTNALRAIGPHSVDLFAPSDTQDPERAEFCKQLASTFHAGAWKVAPLGPENNLVRMDVSGCQMRGDFWLFAINWGVYASGVTVFAGRNDEAQKVARLLIQSLIDHRIGAVLVQAPQLDGICAPPGTEQKAGICPVTWIVIGPHP